MDNKLEEKLISSIEVTGYCWLWVGGLNNCGYGQAYWAKRVQAAHRFVYEALVGPIPKGLQLDHLCEVRSCVNPDHLEPVTKRENARRMVERRGWVHGGAGNRPFGPQLPRKKRAVGVPYKLPMSQRESCKNGHLIAEVGVKLKNRYGKVLELCAACQEDYLKRAAAKKAGWLANASA